jgi:hypothetical protein
MMPEPPGSGVYRSARGCRTRSAVREYPPQRRPLTSEIGCGCCRRFRQVKGVEISVDESARDEARVLPGERSTPMIRIEQPVIARAGGRSNTQRWLANTGCPAAAGHDTDERTGARAPHPALLLRQGQGPY